MNIYLKIIFISMLLLLLPVVFISGGMFKQYSFDVISYVLMIFFPLCSAFIGIYNGLDIKVRWKTIFIFPILFLILLFTLFRIDDSVFILFAGAYLTVGMLSMGVTYFIKMKREQVKKGE